MTKTSAEHAEILQLSAVQPVAIDCCEAVISIETMQGLIDDGMELIVRAPCPVAELQLRGRASGVPLAAPLGGGRGLFLG